ncbi:MAG: tRNA (N6-isopentenyl adenosine(37)-C2)-methylthiotransferase MiaB [Victivallales bacterium]|nr:tRNA (N6-isopentenyl adenosine(37)-C2)-methylthiotransferase MiaB [Victivallales bacterium]
MKYHIHTYGCQMNERESEALAALLNAQGHTPAETEEEADVIILNTCSVREQAERKAFGKAGILKKLFSEGHRPIIGIMGCMAQNRGEELFKLIPHLDFVAGTEQLHLIPEIIADAAAGRRHIAALQQNTKTYHECPGHLGQQVCAMTSVMRGCNQFCTYCIVPFTRGRERSRSIPAIVEEIKELVELHGTKEILLLGQNITAYGLVEAKENGTYTTEISPFADLLEAVNDIEGLERIRFTSPHVRFMNKRFIEAITSLPKVCKSFHIPLQSGSDRMLKAMHRNYTASEYMDCIHSIREKLPEVAFSTDVIVGFCGETEEDFNATRNLMREVGYDMAYIFRYSPRKGTRSAETMTDDVPEETKNQRNQLLLADLEEYAGRRNSTFVGRELEVLVEGTSKRNANRWTGRSDLNKTCNFPPVEGLLPGDMATVMIEKASASALQGKVIKIARRN